MNKNRQIQLAEKFHKLHNQKEILVLANAWDAGSAIIYEKEGYLAIGTTSAGISYSLGFSDGEYINIDNVLDTVKIIQKRVTVPLTVDIESGYGKTNEEILNNVVSVIKEGAVGINIEDTTESNEELKDVKEHCLLIKEIAQLKKELEINFVINARTDVFLIPSLPNKDDLLQEAIARANMFLKAGADCVFIPGGLTKNDISTLVKNINGHINILAMPNSPSIQQLEDLGISRVSLGSGPVRSALATIKNMAKEIQVSNNFESMGKETITYCEANSIFKDNIGI